MNATGQISINFPDPYVPSPPRHITSREAFYMAALSGLLPRVDAYLLTNEELVAKAWDIAEAALKHAQAKGYNL